MQNITVVLGTARESRKSEHVYTYLADLFSADQTCTLQCVDVRDHITDAVTLPPWGAGGADEEPTKWKQIAENTDTFVFILPEYNHGYPGEWKLLVDALYKEYSGKHAYIVSVSGGAFAGVRVADHVKPVLIELGLRVHKRGLHVGNVAKTFDEEGMCRDEQFAERAQTFVDAVKETS